MSGPSQLATIDRRAATWGVVAVLVALAIAVLGSGNLRWFDAALVGYLFGTLFAVFAVVYRYLNRLAGIPYPTWSPAPAGAP